MPRGPRVRSSSGFYHVTMRGVNKQAVFIDDEDYRKFLSFLLDILKDVEFTLHAVCLMGNHVHIVIRVDFELLPTIMRRLGIRYALYFNKKHNRVGHLFQNRYHSQKVETDRDLLAVIRYVYQNPLKAGMVSNLTDYIWSSYRVYFGHCGLFSALIDKSFVLRLFGQNEDTSQQSFKLFMETVNDNSDLEEEEHTLSDRELRMNLLEMLAGLPLETLQTMNKTERDNILRKALALRGASVRQVARVSGLGRGIVHRCKM